jgi:hypothetical protein
MRRTGLGAIIGAVLVLLAGLLVESRNKAAQPSGGPEYGGELITFTSTAAENRQQLTVIDPRSRAMAVYHVDSTTGVVSLKSVRNIQWDLMMSEFNGVSPLPREIRAMVENH